MSPSSLDSDPEHKHYQRERKNKKKGERDGEKERTFDNYEYDTVAYSSRIVFFFRGIFHFSIFLYFKNNYTTW